ncbi:MAG: thymidylate synthase (FAD) [Rickettsiales bacterium]|nr:thymidylate synthase (FAD) [Rickettsiales bacterium]|tara:strand:+ start:5388 stop:6329 length:942 start_codon:yes stop_codon:yes gene_type:complete
MPLNAEQQAEVAAAKSDLQQTYRPVSPELEAVLYEPLPVLDHGFVRVIDYMGDDAAIVQAARVSYGRGTKKVSEDRGLIRYLMRHWHSTPFEMCEIKFHVKLPMFVARQWIRHRTANVNEYSARYSILDKEFYVPQMAQLAPQSAANHQGRAEGDTLSELEAARVLEILKNDSEQCYGHYEELMNCDAQGNVLDENKTGIARELARMNLTMNYYTQWYWKIDLHNLFHFLMLRADSHAQYEIRAYADVMLDVVKKWVPHAAEAFEEYRMQGAHLSGTGVDVVKRMLAGEDVTQENSGLTKREWGELMATLGKA